jgi:hypothetical protein
MKRFLIFAGEFYGNGALEGGAENLRAQVDTLDAAAEWWRYNKRSFYDGWFHTLDLETGRICLRGTWKRPLRPGIYPG